MNIKKGDNVIVLSGKDRGKTGKVIRAFPKENSVVVADVNIKKIHKRANKTNQKGQILEQTFPVNVSNVQLIDSKTGKGTRVRYEMKGNKKIRVGTKSKTEIS